MDGVSPDGRRSTSRLAVWSGILVAAVSWGSGPVAVRAAFDQGFGVVDLAAVRSIAALLSMGAVFGLTGRPVPTSKSVWRMGAVLGIFSSSAVSLLIAAALLHASAGFAGIMLALSPLVSAAMAHLAGAGERLTAAKVAGLSIALFGVAILLGSGDDGLGGVGNPLLAAALMFGVVSLVSSTMVYTKIRAVGVAPIDLALAQFAVSAIVLTGFMILVEGPPSGITATGWALGAYLGAVPQALSFTATYWLLQHTTVTHAMLVTYIHPIVATVLGSLLLSEELGLGLLTGGGLVIVGLVVTDRAQSAAAAADPPINDR